MRFNLSLEMIVEVVEEGTKQKRLRGCGYGCRSVFEGQLDGYLWFDWKAPRFRHTAMHWHL